LPPLGHADYATQRLALTTPSASLVAVSYFFFRAVLRFAVFFAGAFFAADFVFAFAFFAMLPS
jgi:hypothetical protein